jgi:hypothetical protein
MRERERKGKRKVLPFEVGWWLRSSPCLKQRGVANWREAGILTGTDLLESAGHPSRGYLFGFVSGTAPGSQTESARFLANK